MPRQINMHGSWSCKECTNSNYEKVEEAITQSEFVQPNWSGPWCWLNWKLQHMVALVRDVFHITGPEHWHNLNHTHSPISSHFDRVGFAGCNDFVGAGEDVVIMILSWDGNITIFVQEDVSVSSAQNRFSVCVYFTMKEVIHGRSVAMPKVWPIMVCSHINRLHSGSQGHIHTLNHAICVVCP